VARAVRKEQTIRNRNFSHPVTVVQRRPDLDRLGNAGIRMKLDLALSAPEGLTDQAARRLRPEELSVLRKMASATDPARGVPHQAAAIGALAQAADRGSLLTLSEVARSAADARVAVAASYALGEIGGPEAAVVLRDLLGAKATEVRAQAARALAKVGGAGDLAVLERFVSREKTFAGDVARSAADVLRGRLGLR
jgi:HEAT repeat protein